MDYSVFKHIELKQICSVDQRNWPTYQLISIWSYSKVYLNIWSHTREKTDNNRKMNP